MDEKESEEKRGLGSNCALCVSKDAEIAEMNKILEDKRRAIHDLETQLFRFGICGNQRHLLTLILSDVDNKSTVSAKTKETCPTGLSSFAIELVLDMVNMMTSI